MKRWWLLFAEVLLVIVMFCFGGILGIATCPEVCRECPKNVVRNYVWEELYMMTADSGLTKAKVVQQDLFEWGKVYYVDNGVQTFGMNEEDFMKLWGQQKDLTPKKK